MCLTIRWPAASTWCIVWVRRSRAVVWMRSSASFPPSASIGSHALCQLTTIYVATRNLIYVELSQTETDEAKSGFSAKKCSMSQQPKTDPSGPPESPNLLTQGSRVIGHFVLLGVSPRCCGRGWCGGVRSSKLRRPSRG